MTQASAARVKWNEVATKAISDLVGGDVEVVLMKKRNGLLHISILSEDKIHHDDAVKAFNAAGAQTGKSQYYEADEDLPEAWQTTVYLYGQL